MKQQPPIGAKVRLRKNLSASLKSYWSLSGVQDLEGTVVKHSAARIRGRFNSRKTFSTTSQEVRFTGINYSITLWVPTPFLTEATNG